MPSFLSIYHHGQNWFFFFFICTEGLPTITHRLMRKTLTINSDQARWRWPMPCRTSIGSRIRWLVTSARPVRNLKVVVVVAPVDRFLIVKSAGSDPSTQSTSRLIPDIGPSRITLCMFDHYIGPIGLDLIISRRTYSASKLLGPRFCLSKDDDSCMTSWQLTCAVISFCII